MIKYLKPLETPQSKGCLNCGSLSIEMPLSYRLYQAFGGSHIEKDGQIFYMPKNDTRGKTLRAIEKTASKEPNYDWWLIINTPMYDAVYQRQKGKWLLVKKGNGFA